MSTVALQGGTRRYSQVQRYLTQKKSLSQLAPPYGPQSSLLRGSSGGGHLLMSKASL